MILLARRKEALEKLAADSPEKAEIVKLRYFTELKHEEIAQVWKAPPASSASPTRRRRRVFLEGA